MSKQLWKIISSNARAAINLNGNIPQRVYPYYSLEYVSEDKKETQRYLNDCARFVLEFYGGIWLE